MTHPIITTASGYGFCPTGNGSLERSLFQVSPDIPIGDAMANVSVLLGTLHSSLTETALGNRTITSDDAFVMAHTLRSAKAVIDALAPGMESRTE